MLSRSLNDQNSLATLHWLDVLVVCASLALSSVIGLFFAWRQRKLSNNETFLLGDRQMGVIPVSLSLMASYMSAITVLAYPAEVYVRGMALTLSIPASIIASIVIAELFVPVYHRLQLTSMNSISFGGALLFAPSLTIQAVTGFPLEASMLSMGLICTFYTTIGGLKAVIWTDVLQMAIMLTGIAMVAGRTIFDVPGGFHEIIRRNSEAGRLRFIDMTVDPYSAVSFWNCFFGLTSLWIAGMGMTQQQVQRFCSLPTVQKAKRAIYLQLGGLVIVLSVAFFSGFGVYAYYHGCDPVTKGFIQKYSQVFQMTNCNRDLVRNRSKNIRHYIITASILTIIFSTIPTYQVIPYFVMDRLRTPGVPGIFIAGVFAGSLSSLSSLYNSLAACIWEDFVCPWMRRDLRNEEATRYTKLIAFAVGFVTMGFGFVASRTGYVLAASMGIPGAVLGPVCGIFIVGITLPFVNTIGAFAGFTVATLFTVWSAVGRVIYPITQPMLRTSIEFCNASVTIQAVSTITSLGTVFEDGVPPLEPVKPIGIGHVYYIHHYLLPALGLSMAAIISIVVSILTGGNVGKKPDARLFSETSLRLFTSTPSMAFRSSKWFNKAPKKNAPVKPFVEDPLEMKNLRDYVL